MIRKIIFKEKNIERIHPQDSRIWIEENVLQLIKTIGFDHIGKEQENFGYIHSQYVMIHTQTYLQNGRILDSWADEDHDKNDYAKRREDFKKLMKDKNVSDDEIHGPYDRDEAGLKLIGDVVEHKHSEKDHKLFSNLCKLATHQDVLIEIEYEDKSK